MKTASTAASIPRICLSAVYCIQNGDLEKAQSILREARLESPDHPVPALYLGQMARRERQSEAARSFLAAAAALPLPENWPESHQQRFLVLLHSERLQLAEQLLAQLPHFHCYQCTAIP